MRLLTRRIWRAFPELDGYDDELCRKFAHVARRRGVGRHAERLFLAVAGIVTLCVIACGVLVASIVAITGAGDPEQVLERAPAILQVGGALWPLVWAGGAIVVVGPAAFLTMLMRDWFLRRRLRSVLRGTGLCPACGQSLIGLEIPASCIVACPECAQPCIVDAALGVLTQGGHTPIRGERPTIDAVAVAARHQNIRLDRRRRRKRFALIVAAGLFLFVGVPLAVYEFRLRGQAAMAEAEAPTAADLTSLIAAHRPDAALVPTPRVITLIHELAAWMDTIDTQFMKNRLAPDAGMGGAFSLLLDQGLHQKESPGRENDEASAAFARALLAQYEEAGLFESLTALAATRLEVRDLALPPSQLWAVNLPHLGYARRAARVLAARARVAIEQGDSETAAESLRSIFVLRNACALQPLGVEWMTGAAINELGHGLAMQWMASRPTAAELELIELACFKDALPSPELMIRFEAAMQKSAIAAVFTDTSAMRLAPFIGINHPFESGRIWRIGTWRSSMLAIDGQTDLAMAQWMSRHQEPPMRARPSASRQFEDAPLVPLSPGLQYPQSLHRGAWSRSLLQIVIAIERWHLIHGAYPETLAELVPRYLPSVPADPWLGMPLGYRRVDPAGDALGRAYLLYAVGSDGVDDGGVDSLGGHPLGTMPKGSDFILNSASPVQRAASTPTELREPREVEHE